MRIAGFAAPGTFRYCNHRDFNTVSALHACSTGMRLGVYTYADTGIASIQYFIGRLSGLSLD